MTKSVRLVIAAYVMALLCATGCMSTGTNSTTSNSGGSAVAAGSGGSIGSTPIPVGSTSYSLVIGGLTRTYHVYRPAGISTAAPLVVFLHGGFGTGTQAEQYYGWDAEAAANGFIVAYPDGYDRAWNVGGGCCGTPAARNIDDVAFISAVVARVEAGAPIDPRRVFATGISNGGMMDYRLACDTKLFAAIGPDSATELGTCPAPAPVSVIHIHGTADQNVPYNGGPGDGYAHIDGPAVPSVVAGWRATDDCGAASDAVAGAVATSLATCPDGRAVELVTITGAGHQWPGSRDRPLIQKTLGLDQPSTALNATAAIWAFFAAHPAGS